MALALYSFNIGLDRSFGGPAKTTLGLESPPQGLTTDERGLNGEAGGLFRGDPHVISQSRPYEGGLG